MLGFLAGLGLQIFAGHQTTRILGPDHIAASSERVYVHADGHMFVLGDEGETVRHLKPEDLQLAGSVIDLRMMPDGRLLIAERVPARIRLCDTESWLCSEGGIPLAETLSNQYKVLPDTSGKYLYITDSTRGGDLYIVDLAAGSIDPLLSDTFSYANDIQYGPGGNLVVADSYNHRIVNVRVQSDSAVLDRVLFDTQNEAVKEERNWPMMMQALGDGLWAVSQPAATGGKADILIYRDENAAPRRLELDEGLDVTDLAMIGDQFLVCDMLGFALYTLDIESGHHSPWGDQIINAWFEKQQVKRDTYQGWVDLGLMLMVVCAPIMLITGYLGTSRDNRPGLFGHKGAPKLMPSDDAPPVLSSIYWLRRNPKMDCLFRWMKPIMTALVAVMLLTMAYLLRLLYEVEPERISEILIVFLVFAGVMAGMLPLMYINMDMVRGQLGTDGNRIFVRLPDGEQGSAMPGQVIYTKHFIHFGRHTISIGSRKNQALYEEGEVETYIAPLLKHARKVNIFGLLAQQLQDGEYGQIYTWFYVFGAIAAVIYLEFGDKLKALQ